LTVPSGFLGRVLAGYSAIFVCVPNTEYLDVSKLCYLN